MTLNLTLRWIQGNLEFVILLLQDCKQQLHVVGERQGPDPEYPHEEDGRQWQARLRRRPRRVRHHHQELLR